MSWSLGPAEVLVILVVALIVLGPNRLPQAGRQIGRAMAEIRRWSQGVQDEIKSAVDMNPEPQPRSPMPEPAPEPPPLGSPEPAAGAEAPPKP